MQVRTTETPRITRKRKERSCDRENGNEGEADESGSSWSAAAWSEVIGAAEEASAAAAASPSGPERILQLESQVMLDASHLLSEVLLVENAFSVKLTIKYCRKINRVRM